MADPAAAPDRLPPEHRTRLIQGVAAWLFLAVCVSGWIAMKAPDAVKAYAARIPRAAAEVKLVYLTPQIVDSPGVTFDQGSGPAVGVSGQGAYVSVIMTGLGLSQETTVRAIEDMPEGVTLAFSPYGDLPGWIGKAQETKHESLVLLPMEPDSYPRNDPGPKALLTRVSTADNATVLAAILKRSSGAGGVMNFMGSRFLKDEKSLKNVFDTLAKAGAIFVESRKEEGSVAENVAKTSSLPYLSGDIVIDEIATETDVAQKLGELENLARKSGAAVGVASPYPVSFNMIKSWAAGLEKRGVTLIPVSAMVKVQAHHAEK